MRNQVKDFNKQKQPKRVRPENYWRYKKQTPPVDENPELNGPVTVRKINEVQVEIIS